MGSSALTTSPVDTSQGEPSQPAAAAAASGGALAVPLTGAAANASGGTAPAAQPAQSTEPAQPAKPTEPAVAAVQPTAQNLPPTILDHIGAPIEAKHGEAMNLRLGAFDDEEGAASLMMRVEGRLPNGLQFIKADGGVAQLYGQPVESGNFSFEVAAVDQQGLVSTFPVSLTVEPPAAFRDLRDYILGYDGGACFLARPLQLGDKSAQIEVFAANVDPVIKFDGDFKAARGFEANIGMRPISGEQCGLINALDKVGAQALDNRLQFRIVKDQLKSGETLEGVVAGGEGARLFLYDNTGGVTDLAPYVTSSPEGAKFSLPLHAVGPQVLVAAIADPASGLGANAGLEDLLNGAHGGGVALALGFIMLE